MEELVSLLRVLRRKKDLRDPKMPLQEGKRNEKSALAGLGGRKSRARPEKAEKTGLGGLIFTNQTRTRRKISLHNAKKYAIAGLREKKSRVRPAPLLCRQGKPQKYLKNGFVGIFYRWVPEETGTDNNRLKQPGKG